MPTLQWQPVPEIIAQVVHMLRCCLMPDTNLQREANNALQIHRANPEFARYLISIFVRIPELDINLRSVAGAILKQTVESEFGRFSPETQAFVKQELLFALQNAHHDVRKAAANAVSTIVRNEHLRRWPELAQSLALLLEAPSEDAVEGALLAISQLAEDNAQDFDDKELGHPLNHMVPKLIAAMRHGKEPFRRMAAQSMSQFLYTQAAGLLGNMSSYLEALSALTGDPSPSVRRVVCFSLATLVETNLSHVWPHIGSILEFILRCTLDPTEEVVLAAIDFWTVLVEALADYKSNNQPEIFEVMVPYLPTILPALLDRLVYTEADLEAIPGYYDGDDVDDRAEDIRPHIHRAVAGATVENNASASTPTASDDDTETEDDDFDPSDPHTEVRTWTVRKAASGALDMIATVYQHAILPILLPLVEGRLLTVGDTEREWRIREVGLLALGAIADGCIELMGPYMDRLYPYLLARLNDGSPLVRSIACWCLAKYSSWVLEMEFEDMQDDASRHDRYLQPLAVGLIRLLLDTKKKVQEMACAALVTVAEGAQELFAAYLPQLVQAISIAFTRYYARNRIRLYDLIGGVTEATGPEIAKPEYLSQLLPPIIKRYGELRDIDPELIPVMEALTALVTAAGSMLSEIIPHLCTRSLHLIEHDLVLENAARTAGEPPPKSQELMTTGLDVLCGIAEGAPQAFESLLPGSNMLELVHECIKQPSPQVRQSSLALVGEMAKAAWPLFAPHLKEYVPPMTVSIRATHTNSSACNNAIWAIGEIALRAGPDIAPFVNSVLDRLEPIMSAKDTIRSISENSAIALGRLAIVAPQLVAARLSRYVSGWCRNIILVQEPTERFQAYSGFCQAIAINPRSVMDAFGDIAVAFAVYSNPSPPPELLHTMNVIVHTFKSVMPPDQWGTLLKRMSKELRTKMDQTFGPL